MFLIDSEEATGVNASIQILQVSTFSFLGVTICGRIEDIVELNLVPQTRLGQDTAVAQPTPFPHREHQSS